MTLRILKIQLIISLLLLFVGNTNAQIHATDRSSWFVDSRFGMFIHWGIYSGAEGIWKGEKLRYDNNYAEWIFYRNSIDKQEYIELLDEFDWAKINPEDWVLTAKKAGMKYIIFTAKHHDGFALWDSDVSDYNIAYYTNGQRDIVKELAEACKKHNIKLGLYYSHWIDWENPNAWSHDKEIYSIDNQQYNKYWQEKVIPQITELLTNYGDISILWFDMWLHHSETIIAKQQLIELKQLIRKLQPSCLINSRLGLSLDEDPDIDFKTLNDNELGQTKENFPWQSPATIAHSWGFSAYEEQWKSTTTLLHNLINNVSLNGNMVLNIGPRANGDIPYEIQDRLMKIGNWLEIYGESIYGAKAYDLPKKFNDWGKITCKNLSNGKTRLYLHVYNWSGKGNLTFSGILQPPQRAFLLNDSLQTPLKTEHQDVLTKIEVPDEAPDKYVSVIVLEYDKYPRCKYDFVAVNSRGGFNLNPQNIQTSSDTFEVEKVSMYGSVPEHIPIFRQQVFKWRIYISEPCVLKVDMSYFYSGEKQSGFIKIKSDNEVVEQKLLPGRKTVGEPNKDWHIKRFEAHKIGNLHFPKKGFYSIEAQINPNKNETVDFQWIYLQKVKN